MMSHNVCRKKKGDFGGSGDSLGFTMRSEVCESGVDGGAGSTYDDGGEGGVCDGGDEFGCVQSGGENIRVKNGGLGLSGGVRGIVGDVGNVIKDRRGGGCSTGSPVSLSSSSQLTASASGSTAESMIRQIDFGHHHQFLQHIAGRGHDIGIITGGVHGGRDDHGDCGGEDLLSIEGKRFLSAFEPISQENKWVLSGFSASGRGTGESKLAAKQSHHHRSRHTQHQNMHHHVHYPDHNHPNHSYSHHIHPQHHGNPYRSSGKAQKGSHFAIMEEESEYNFNHCGGGGIGGADADEDDMDEDEVGRIGDEIDGDEVSDDGDGEDDGDVEDDIDVEDDVDVEDVDVEDDDDDSAYGDDSRHHRHPTHDDDDGASSRYSSATESGSRSASASRASSRSCSFDEEDDDDDNDRSDDGDRCDDHNRSGDHGRSDGHDRSDDDDPFGEEDSHSDGDSSGDLTYDDVNSTNSSSDDARVDDEESDDDVAASMSPLFPDGEESRERIFGGTSMVWKMAHEHLQLPPKLLKEREEKSSVKMRQEIPKADMAETASKNADRSTKSGGKGGGGKNSQGATYGGSDKTVGGECLKTADDSHHHGSQSINKGDNTHTKANYNDQDAVAFVGDAPGGSGCRPYAHEKSHFKRFGKSNIIFENDTGDFVPENKGRNKTNDKIKNDKDSDGDDVPDGSDTNNAKDTSSNTNKSTSVRADDKAHNSGYGNDKNGDDSEKWHVQGRGVPEHSNQKHPGGGKRKKGRGKGGGGGHASALDASHGDRETNAYRETVGGEGDVRGETAVDDCFAVVDAGKNAGDRSTGKNAGFDKDEKEMTGAHLTLESSSTSVGACNGESSSSDSMPGSASRLSHTQSEAKKMSKSQKNSSISDPNASIGLKSILTPSSTAATITAHTKKSSVGIGRGAGKGIEKGVGKGLDMGVVKDSGIGVEKGKTMGYDSDDDDDDDDDDSDFDSDYEKMYASKASSLSSKKVKQTNVTDQSSQNEVSSSSNASGSVGVGPKRSAGGSGSSDKCGGGKCGGKGDRKGGGAGIDGSNCVDGSSGDSVKVCDTATGHVGSSGDIGASGNSSSTSGNISTSGNVNAGGNISNSDGVDDDDDGSVIVSDHENIQEYKKGGYHRVQIGEVYNERYRIESKLGWGHFSTVWLATDLKSGSEGGLMGGAVGGGSLADRAKSKKKGCSYTDNAAKGTGGKTTGSGKLEFVAVKFQKASKHLNKYMGLEVVLHKSMNANRGSPQWLKMMSEAQAFLGHRFPAEFPCVQLRDFFVHQGPNGYHSCLVFDHLGPNVLQLIKLHKYKGTNLDLVRRIAVHTLLGLDYLHRICRIVHTDVKPENICVSAAGLPPPRPADQVGIKWESVEWNKMNPEERKALKKKKKRIQRKERKKALQQQLQQASDEGEEDEDDDADSGAGGDGSSHSNGDGCGGSVGVDNAVKDIVENWKGENDKGEGEGKKASLEPPYVKHRLKHSRSDPSLLTSYTNSIHSLQSTLNRHMYNFVGASQYKPPSAYLNHKGGKELFWLPADYDKESSSSSDEDWNENEDDFEDDEVDEQERAKQEQQGTHLPPRGAETGSFKSDKNEDQKVKQPSAASTAVDCTYTEIHSKENQSRQTAASDVVSGGGGKKKKKKKGNNSDTHTDNSSKTGKNSSSESLGGQSTATPASTSSAASTSSIVSVSDQAAESSSSAALSKTSGQDSSTPVSTTVPSASASSPSASSSVSATKERRKKKDRQKLFHSAPYPGTSLPPSLLPKDVVFPQLHDDHFLHPRALRVYEQKQGERFSRLERRARRYRHTYDKIGDNDPVPPGCQVIDTAEGRVVMKSTSFGIFHDPNAAYKLCDMGNANWLNQGINAPIQTRQYRSPEVLLGAGFDGTADIWSLACTLFELATGDYLFEPRASRSFSKEDDHFAMIIELLGEFPQSLLDRGTRTHKYFKEGTSELLRIPNLNMWDLEAVLLDRYEYPPHEARAFADFLLPMLAIDPKDRKREYEMLSHPWLRMVSSKDEQDYDQLFRRMRHKKASPGSTSSPSRATNDGGSSSSAAPAQPTSSSVAQSLSSRSAQPPPQGVVTADVPSSHAWEDEHEIVATLNGRDMMLVGEGNACYTTNTDVSAITYSPVSPPTVYGHHQQYQKAYHHNHSSHLPNYHHHHRHSYPDHMIVMPSSMSSAGVNPCQSQRDQSHRQPMQNKSHQHLQTIQAHHAHQSQHCLPHSSPLESNYVKSLPLSPSLAHSGSSHLQSVAVDQYHLPASASHLPSSTTSSDTSSITRQIHPHTMRSPVLIDVGDSEGMRGPESSAGDHSSSQYMTVSGQYHYSNINYKRDPDDNVLGSRVSTSALTRMALSQSSPPQSSTLPKSTPSSNSHLLLQPRHLDPQNELYSSLEYYHTQGALGGEEGDDTAFTLRSHEQYLRHHNSQTLTQHLSSNCTDQRQLVYHQQSADIQDRHPYLNLQQKQHRCHKNPQNFPLSGHPHRSLLNQSMPFITSSSPHQFSDDMVVHSSVESPSELYVSVTRNMMSSPLYVGDGDEIRTASDKSSMRNRRGNSSGCGTAGNDNINTDKRSEKSGGKSVADHAVAQGDSAPSLARRIYESFGRSVADVSRGAVNSSSSQLSSSETSLPLSSLRLNRVDEDKKQLLKQPSNHSSTYRHISNASVSSGNVYYAESSRMWPTPDVADVNLTSVRVAERDSILQQLCGPSDSAAKVDDGMIGDLVPSSIRPTTAPGELVMSSSLSTSVPSPPSILSTARSSTMVAPSVASAAVALSSRSSERMSWMVTSDSPKLGYTIPCNSGSDGNIGNDYIASGDASSTNTTPSNNNASTISSSCGDGSSNRSAMAHGGLSSTMSCIYNEFPGGRSVGIRDVHVASSRQGRENCGSNQSILPGKYHGDDDEHTDGGAAMQTGKQRRSLSHPAVSSNSEDDDSDFDDTDRGEKGIVSSSFDTSEVLARLANRSLRPDLGEGERKKDDADEDNDDDGDEVFSHGEPMSLCQPEMMSSTKSVEACAAMGSKLYSRTNNRIHKSDEMKNLVVRRGSGDGDENVLTDCRAVPFGTPSRNSLTTLKNASTSEKFPKGSLEARYGEVNIVSDTTMDAVINPHSREVSGKHLACSDLSIGVGSDGDGAGTSFIDGSSTCSSVPTVSGAASSAAAVVPGCSKSSYMRQCLMMGYGQSLPSSSGQPSSSPSQSPISSPALREDLGVACGESVKKGLVFDENESDADRCGGDSHFAPPGVPFEGSATPQCESPEGLGGLMRLAKGSKESSDAAMNSSRQQKGGWMESNGMFWENRLGSPVLCDGSERGSRPSTATGLSTAASSASSSVSPTPVPCTSAGGTIEPGGNDTGDGIDAAAMRGGGKSSPPDASLVDSLPDRCLGEAEDGAGEGHGVDSELPRSAGSEGCGVKGATCVPFSAPAPKKGTGGMVHVHLQGQNHCDPIHNNTTPTSGGKAVTDEGDDPGVMHDESRETIDCIDSTDLLSTHSRVASPPVGQTNLYTVDV